VGTADLDSNAVTTAKIADGDVLTADLDDNAVTSAKIADGNVRSVDLSYNSVSSIKIQDGEVRTDDLDANAVTTAKIADGTITAADVDPTSSIYVSKSQLYVREEAFDIDPVQGLFVAVVYCDDADDLPLSGSCDSDPGTGVELVSIEDDNWTHPTNPAEWACTFYNRLSSVATVRSRILCISVP